MSTEPLFWYRPRTDGGYEGPLHNGQIEDVRKASGAWVPLFAGAAPVSAEPVGWLGVEAGNILVARRSKWINGCADRLIALGGRTDDFILNTYVTQDDIADFETMTAPVAAQQDAELLQFVIDEECLVTNTVVCGDDHWRVAWPHLGEVQAEFHPTARDAIRAAIDAARKEPGQ